MIGIIDEIGVTHIATVRAMTRMLDLAQWAGRWVALDNDDAVQCSAEALGDLHALLDSEGIGNVEIVRAPVPGEPAAFGLG